MVVMGVLTAYKVRGAILIGIVVGTVISIPMGVSTLPASVFSLPDVSELGNLFLCYDFKSILADIPALSSGSSFCSPATFSPPSAL